MSKRKAANGSRSQSPAKGSRRQASHSGSMNSTRPLKNRLTRSQPAVVVEFNNSSTPRPVTAIWPKETPRRVQAERFIAWALKQLDGSDTKRQIQAMHFLVDDVFPKYKRETGNEIPFNNDSKDEVNKATYARLFEFLGGNDADLAESAAELLVVLFGEHEHKQSQIVDQLARVIASPNAVTAHIALQALNQLDLEVAIRGAQAVRELLLSTESPAVLHDICEFAAGWRDDVFDFAEPIANTFSRITNLPRETLGALLEVLIAVFQANDNSPNDIASFLNERIERELLLNLLPGLSPAARAIRRLILALPSPGPRATPISPNEQSRVPLSSSAEIHTSGHSVDQHPNGPTQHATPFGQTSKVSPEKSGENISQNCANGDVTSVDSAADMSPETVLKSHSGNTTMWAAASKIWVNSNGKKQPLNLSPYDHWPGILSLIIERSVREERVSLKFVYEQRNCRGKNHSREFASIKKLINKQFPDTVLFLKKTGPGGGVLIELRDTPST